MELSLIGKLSEDCNGLIQYFAGNNPSRYHDELNFTNFAKKWKEEKFYLIFSGYLPEELPVLANVLFGLAKDMMLNPVSNEKEQRAAAFLLYSLYYTQPFEKSKIRLTLNESQKLDVFFEEVKSSKVKETAFVLAKLFLENALVPCYTQKEALLMNQQPLKDLNFN